PGPTGTRRTKGNGASNDLRRQFPGEFRSGSLSRRLRTGGGFVGFLSARTGFGVKRALLRLDPGIPSVIHGYILDVFRIARLRFFIPYVPDVGARAGRSEMI